MNCKRTEPASINEKIYRIAWKSKITGRTRHGGWGSLETIEFAKHIATREHPEILHWIEKKLEWQKPELIEFTNTISSNGDVGVRCEDICMKGNNARYLCSKGAGVK